MKKNQWILAGLTFIAVIGLYAATQKKIFGLSENKKPAAHAGQHDSFSADSILLRAKEKLSAEQLTRLNFLEHSITRGDVKDQQIHIYHQLARFWGDTVRMFEPYAWYTAEGARLENSEKSLTFAAHLFLDNLVMQHDPQIKQWEALQAKDLFERSLKLNPTNDSSKVGLGAVLVYGGIAMPMEGVGKIREVADKDSTNIYAQMTLGEASLMSGQLDKAIERFRRVARLQPENLVAIIRAAETAEQIGNKDEAVKWYEKSLPLIKIPELKQEVEARIAKLKNNK